MTITKAALLLFQGSGSDRELLFVRAAGKPHWVFPGGKQEANETIEQALERELVEELGTGVKFVKKLGVVTGATPDGRALQMHLYTGTLTGKPHAAAEIEELLWLTKSAALALASEMTPMTLLHVFPFLDAQGLW